MNSDSRVRIMTRIRGASAGADTGQIEQELESFGAAPAAPLLHDDLRVAFIARVLKNQGTLAVAPDRGSAVRAVGHYVYEHLRSHRLVAGNDPHLAAMPWRDGGVLPRFGELEPGEPVALSYARLGVAETGAVVTLTGKGNPAANNLLPERHIVLLEVDNVVPDLETLWSRLQPILDREGRPRGINCIAGPSSTADVEATLVYGAHGPRAWHVVLMGDVNEAHLDLARTVAGLE
jgi:L-lactate dehydrogenase complex protein LldG